MTIAVDLGRKATKPTNQNLVFGLCLWHFLIGITHVFSCYNICLSRGRHEAVFKHRPRDPAGLCNETNICDIFPDLNLNCTEKVA